MKKAPVIILLACISILGSCGKSPFSNGEEKTYDRQLEDTFTIVDIGDNLNVTLLHSDVSHPSGMIHIITGENLIDGIRTEIAGDTLVIRNENTLGFLRPYDYPRELTVYYDSLYQITLNSNAENIQTDTLRGYSKWTHFTHDNNDTIGFDSLVSNLLVEIQGGSGNFNMLASCYKVSVKYFYGTSTLNIKGRTNEASFYGNYDCHGIIDGSDLESDNARIVYYGTGTVIGKAFNRFTAINNNIGRIYYIRYNKTKPKPVWGHFEGPHWVPTYYIDTTYSCPLSVVKLGDHPENIKHHP